MLPIVQKEHKVAPQHITTTAATTKKKWNIANACTEYDHNNISYLNICLNSYKTINHKQCNTFNWAECSHLHAANICMYAWQCERRNNDSFKAWDDGIDEYLNMLALVVVVHKYTTEMLAWDESTNSMDKHWTRKMTMRYTVHKNELKTACCSI